MRFLGKTLTCLVMDSFSGFSAETLAALSGCIAGGGCLIWLVPENLEVGESLQTRNVSDCLPTCQIPSASRNAYLRYVLADATGPSAMTCWSRRCVKTDIDTFEASDIPFAVDSP